MKSKLAVIYLCAFIGPLGGNAVLALIPSLKSAFGIGEAEVLMAITMFMLPFAIGQLFTGVLARIYDQKKTMIAGYMIYAAGSVIAGSALNISEFLAARIIQGIGFALVSPVTVAILGDLTEPRSRGRHMGLLNAALGGGIFLGPIMAGSFAKIDWRLTFYALGFIAIAAAYAFWTAFRDMTFERKTATGSVLRAELGSVLSSPKVILLCCTGFITFFAFIGVISLTSDHISAGPNALDEFQLGLLLASSGLAQIVLAVPGGVIVDTLGRYRTGYIGFGTAAFIAFLFTAASSFGQYVILFAAFGFSAVMIWAVLVTLSVEIMPEKKIYITAVFNSIRFFGYAISPILLVPIYVNAGIAVIYMICACILIAGIVMMLQLSKHQ